MNQNSNKRLQNEEGSSILLTVVVLALITVLAIAALNDTSIELMATGNDRRDKVYFYQVEQALNTVTMNFQSVYSTQTNDSETTTLQLNSSDDFELEYDFDNDEGDTIAKVIIVPITDSANTIHNDTISIPKTKHIGSAPEGYQDEMFSTRRFAITAIAIDKSSGELTNKWVQAGTTIPEETESVLHLR